MPNEELTYRESVSERMKRFEVDMRESQTRQELKLDTIDKKISYTNGKVRKIIMVLLVLGGILVGQTFTNAHDIISLFANAL